MTGGIYQFGPSFWTADEQRDGLMRAFAALSPYGHGRDVPLKASAAARLMRAYASQVETLRRLKNGGSQVVRVEHVHVNEGGQALIGNVRKDGSGGESEK